MKKILPALFLFALNQVFAQINVQWEARFNGASNNIDRVADMFVDAAGNVYVTGSSYSSVSGFDIVTIKYDNAGTQLWSSTFNGSGNGSDNASALAVDASGNVYVAGTAFRSGTDYDFTVIKYNGSGTLQWQVYNGSTFYDEAREITVDAANEPIVVGGFQATSSNTNFRTLKLNSSTGATTWFQDFSNSTNLDIAVNVTTDASNNVYVTGHSFQTGQDLNIRTIKYNSAGTVQWSTQHNENSTLNSYDMPSYISVDASGNTYVLGVVFNGSVSDDDILLVKYNTTGVVTGTLELNGTANDKDKAGGLVVDASGNIYIGGRIKGVSTAEDFLVAKYNSSFTQLWIDKYNGSGSNYDEAVDIKLDGTGAYLYATGYSFLSASNNDYVTIKYDASTGNHEWITRFNGPANNSDQARSMSIDGTGNVYVSGDSKGSGTNLDYSTIKYCQLTTVASVDDDTICVGQTINLTVAGGLSASWTVAGTAGLSCTSCTNPTSTPTADEIYIVSTQSATGCVDYDTVEVIVNPLPGPVITADGPTTFCIGDSVELTASGFALYSWNTGETSSTIMADTTGTYTVTVTDADGCANFTSVNIIVNGLPSISAGANEAHCQGDSTQLAASGGVSYVWNSDPFISSTSIFDPYVFPSVPGTYSYVVTGTDINGCKNSDTVEVTVNPTPATPLLFRPGSSDLIFVTNFTNGISWYQNGTYLPAAGSINQLNLADTLMPWACQVGITNNYTAQYTDSNGCVSPMSAPLVVDTLYSDDCYIGVMELDFATNVLMYPNPANHTITLEFNLSQVQNIVLSIMDMAGQMVKSNQYVNLQGRALVQLNVSTLESGIYQLVLQNEKGNTKTSLFIKQ